MSRTRDQSGCPAQVQDYPSVVVAGVEDVVAEASRSIGQGMQLRAALAMLDTASDLLDLDATPGVAGHVPANYEVRFQIESLRGIVQRDNFEIDLALQSFATAHTMSRRAGDQERSARMSLAMATAANMGGYHDGALWCRGRALSEAASLRRASRQALGVEALAKVVQRAEMMGDQVGAEYLCRSALVPRSRRYEPDELLVARLVTWARLSVAVGDLKAAARALDEATSVKSGVPSMLRDVQWRCSLALLLGASGEDDAAADQAAHVYRVLSIGQFDNAPARALLRRYALEIPRSTRQSQTRGKHGVTYNIFGDGNNIAIGSSNFDQHNGVAPIAVGDRDALYRVLASAGVAADDIERLGAALDEDEAMKATFGPRVHGWLDEMGHRAASAGGAIAIGAGGGVVGQALIHYFGIG